MPIRASARNSDGSKKLGWSDIIDLTCQVGGGRAMIAALEDDVARLPPKDDRRTLSPRNPECDQIIYFICSEVVALL